MPMLRLFLLVGAALLLGACQREDPLALQRDSAHAAAAADWSDGIDFDQLAEAVATCEVFGDKLRDCTTVMRRRREVVDAIASCAGHSSELCQALRAGAARHPIPVGRLGPGQAVILPDHSFYWSLPNELLAAQDARFGYRAEMWAAWWARWQTIVQWLLGLTLIGVAVTGAWVIRHSGKVAVPPELPEITPKPAPDLLVAPATIMLSTPDSEPPPTEVAEPRPPLPAELPATTAVVDDAETATTPPTPEPARDRARRDAETTTLARQAMAAAFGKSKPDDQ